MSRDEIMAYIKGRGYDACDVEYSGGGDEGGVDSVSLYKHGPQPGKDQEDKIEIMEGGPEREFYDAVTAYIEGEYGFNGGGVHGTVTYDAVTGYITDDGAAEEWVPFKHEVNL